MRIIKFGRLVEFWTEHSRAKGPLERWHEIAKHALWKSFNDVRKTFGPADEVRVASGRTVVVFNIGGNSFRLICAIHYNTGHLFVLRFLTHAEYDKNNWKKDL